MSFPPEYFERIRKSASDFEVWVKITKSSKTSAFVLSDLKVEPIELDGHCLKNIFKEETIKLYPTTYRIVYKNDN